MKLARTITITLLALWVAGCATTQQAPEVVESGFLTEYSYLRPGGEGEALLVYRNAEADFTVYDKILFERVTIWRSAEEQLEDVPEADLRRLADHLYLAVYDKLAKDYEMVEEAGPGVLRIALALTEVKESKVGLDIFSTVAPPARVVSEARNLATGTQAFVGGATVEAELSDAETGEILVAAVDSRVGRKSLRGAASSWSDVEESFEFWAERISQRLGEARRGEWPPK